MHQRDPTFPRARLLILPLSQTGLSGSTGLFDSRKFAPFGQTVRAFFHNQNGGTGGQGGSSPPNFVSSERWDVQNACTIITRFHWVCWAALRSGVGGRKKERGRRGTLTSPPWLGFRSTARTVSLTYRHGEEDLLPYQSCVAAGVCLCKATNGHCHPCAKPAHICANLLKPAQKFSSRRLGSNV